MVRSVVTALLAAAATAFAMACGGEAAPARTALTPIATAEVEGALELATVASAAAIESARQHMLKVADDVGAAEMPREAVARITTARDVSSWAASRQKIGGGFPEVAPETFVWAVQMEGEWRPGVPSDATAAAMTTTSPGATAPAATAPARFAVVAIEAAGGAVVGVALSPDPFMVPKRLRSNTTFDCVAFEPADGKVVLGPAEAIEAVRAVYPPGSVNKYGGEWAVDRADAEIARCLNVVGGVETFRWRWFVTVPSKMVLADCATPSSRPSDLKRRCWPPVATHLVDGITGQVMTRREAEFTGPLLSDREFDEVQRFASSAGWWEAWARLSPFNDAIVPAAALNSLTTVR